MASCAYLTGDYLSVLKASERLAQSPALEAEALYWETKSVGDLATQSLARASTADPNSPKLHVLLGDIYRQQKNVPEAEKEYRQALALRPEDTGALFGLALALLANRQTDEALSLAQAALDSDKDGSLHYQIARLYMKVGDRASANQAFEVSQRIQREGLIRATVAMEQGANDTESR